MSARPFRSVFAALLLELVACAPAIDGGDDDGGSTFDGGSSDAGERDGGASSACVPASGTGTLPSTVEDGALRMVASASALGECANRYVLSTNQTLRDGLPGNPRTVDERAGQPTLRSSHVAFDALYALALDEVREASVDAISDGSFNDGRPVACPEGGCIETGRLWKYVWTRDLAFAAHLGLAPIDPVRVRNSLGFKLSARRGGGAIEVVQDTGTGGSWPASSDRVAWALGAWELLKYLDGPSRAAFRDDAFEALKNTLERDRAVVFDPKDGLYTGETSFLDWREQTYPAWTARDPVHIAMSKSLSTNALHSAAMDVFAALATEKGDEATAALWRTRAGALRAAAREKFHLAGTGLFSSFLNAPLDGGPVQRHDLLGHALAILGGVADDAQARDALSKYPHLAAGAPAVWPQQQFVPSYHNRSIWPFTVAYWAKAGRRMRHDAAVTHATRSLVRAAALNLSNMENLEMVSGAPYADDGAHSGPVVNSQRQIWSVAGFISLVHDVIFGLEATQDGLRFAPYVTKELRNSLFHAADALVLNGFSYKGARVDVVVKLPARGGSRDGAYDVATVRLNGRELDAGAWLTRAMLGASNRLEVTLVENGEGASTLTLVSDTSDHRRLFGPREPAIEAIAPAGDRLQLAIDAGGESAADIVFDVSRDGLMKARDLDGTTTTWTDPDARTTDGRTWCWTVASRFRTTGTASHASRPACFWGASFDRVQTVSARDFEFDGATGVVSDGRYHLQDWGDPGDELSAYVRALATGPHLLQLVGSNGAGPVSTGVACGVKLVEVRDVDDGAEVVATGTFVLPQTGSWADWRDSSFVRADLVGGHAYRVIVRDDPLTANMSAFAHFAQYTAGGVLGGRAGAFSRVNVSELKVLALGGYPAAASRKHSFDGVRDFEEFGEENRLTPGLTFDGSPWERFAFDWDADDLYVAAVVSRFQSSESTPLMLYLQAESGETFSPPQARAGIEYGGQTPGIPFQATHAIGVRRRTELGADGPWNGLFRHDGTKWVRQARFETGRTFWANSDLVTIAFRVPRAALGNPKRLRLVAHVPAGGGLWKDVVPAQHQPWEAARTTGFFELDLSGSTAISSWQAR